VVAVVATMVDSHLGAFPPEDGSTEGQPMTGRRGLSRKCTAHLHHRELEVNQSQKYQLSLPRQFFPLGHRRHMR
jgi:hypothetical protein